MKIAVFGTGEVGRKLATKLVELGHDVTLGSRTAHNEAAREWAYETGGHHGTFADAAQGAELLVNATNGAGTIDALTAAGADNLRGKVLIDVTNALDFSEGFPPKVTTYDGLSLGELIQRTFPDVRVVKSLNTMNNTVMVEPSLVPGDHTVFMSGDDASAKAEVASLLTSFGWRDAQILDLGGIGTARGVEQMILNWLSISQALGTGTFNIGVHRGE